MLTHSETQAVVRDLKRTGGFSTAPPMGRNAGLTVRVMLRENCGRPVKGDRKSLGGAMYAVAEYHGNRCHRVITGTDSVETAFELAEIVAAPIGARVVSLLSQKLKKATNGGKRSRTGKARTLAPKTVKKAAETDTQRLHVRDIDSAGFCSACESKDRMHPCGKPETEAEPAMPELSAWEMAFAKTAHLRGE